MNKYYEDERISQSYLKRFLNNNPRALYRGLDEEYYYTREKIHFSKGKLLDLLLEGGDIDDYFYIESAEYKRPSDSVFSVAKEVYDLYGLNATEEQINEIRTEQSYQKRYTLETALKWAREVIKPILKDLEQRGDKVVITAEEYKAACCMSSAILFGSFTKPILDEIEGEFQVALYTEELKCLIDYLQIDHDKKVFRVVDFKTTGDYLERFKKSILKFRYDIQLSFYSYIVSQLYPTYKMLEPVLIVVSTKEPDYAEPFTLSTEIVKNARKGWIDKYGNTYKGWEQLLTIANNYNQEMYNADLINNGTNYINEL